MGWGGKGAPLSQPGHPLEVSVLVAPSLSVVGSGSRGSMLSPLLRKPGLLASGQRRISG